MPYIKVKGAALDGTPVLVARHGYGGMGDISSFFSSLFSGYNATEQAQGAQQQALLQAQANAAGSLDPTTLLLVGLGGFILYKVLKKKKPASTTTP
jgi:hypothetical protein